MGEQNEAFPTNGAQETGHPWAKKMELWQNYAPYTKINSKWIVGFNINPKTIKLLGEKFGDLGKEFIDPQPKYNP